MPGGKTDPPDRKGGSKDIGIQVNLQPKKKTVTLELPKWLLWLLLVLVLIGGVSYFVTNFIAARYVPRWNVDPNLMEDIGVEGVILFRQHDRDDDGYLSLQEFEPLAHKLVEVNVSEVYDYEKSIEDWDEVVTVETTFKPLDLTTMTKDTGGGFGGLDSLAGLRHWRAPVKEWKNFAASHFKGFMPDPYILESVGEVYEIIPNIDVGGAALSGNRYYPPMLGEEGEIAIHRLLSMFNKRPFVKPRFNPRGSLAVVRAKNKGFVDIVFRIHAEFQLNDPPFGPFWFTPAQFTGNLILSKDGTRLLHFHMFVPTDKKLNVDMEWLNGAGEEDNMEVDIGFMPAMELKVTRSSVGVMFGGKDQRESHIPTTSDHQASIEAIQWEEEISYREALKKLEVKMYPFKKIPYYNITEAHQLALTEGKLVHSILLWGALDDQSC